MVFHVTAAEDWRVAQATGEYRLSTRGKTLDQVGFIHCSNVDQVTRVANLIYRGEHSLVLLAISRERVVAPIRDEPTPSGEERFPHVYGPLNLDAVVATIPFEPNVDGSFSLPEALSGHLRDSSRP